jgi:signal transduction histidine kinase/ligand-binding sensor domain-containing protein/DNA-binding response OmpR family regulator
MIQMQLKRIVIVILILLPCRVFGMDHQQFLFHHLNTSHGLSSDNVFSIVQDSLGFIWIATSDGLNKYDGYTFKQYRHNHNDPSSLIYNPLNTNNSLFLDSQERLWIISAKGVSRYLPGTDSFLNLIPDSSNVKEQGYNYITDICEGPNGTFYFSSTVGLIFTYHESSNKFKLLNNRRFGPNITDLLLQDDALWVACGSGGLSRMDLKTKEISHFSPDKLLKNGANVKINHLFKTGNLLYILTDQHGIFSYNLRTKHFQEEDFRGLISPLTMKEIDSDLWVGANVGIFIRTKEKEIKHIPTHSINPYGLHSDAKAILNDDQGNIWVGGTMGGLNILRNNYGFSHYIPNQNSNLNLSTEKVSSLYSDEEGGLWVGYFSGEIDRFLKDRNSSYGAYRKEKISDNYGRGTIFDLKKDLEGNLLACTYHNGLEKYYPEEGGFIPLDLKINVKGEALQSMDVRAFCQDSDGVYWLVVHGEGLCKYDMENHEQLFFFSDSGAIDNQLSNVYGYDVVCDNDGDIWMSTSYGLNRIDYQTNRVTQYYFDEDNDFGIASNLTSTLFVDSQNRVWIATDNGVSVFNREENNFWNIDKNIGLNYSDIRGITEDSDGAIWVTSRMNISRIFFPATKEPLKRNNIRIENFEISAFSGYNEFFPGALIIIDPGIICIGGSKGIFTFDSRKDLDKTINIPVYISDVQVFNESLPVNNSKAPGSLKKQVSLVDTLVLRHNQNMLTFEFVGLHFASPGEIEYAYMLEGLENQWHHTSEKTKVTYGNLKPQQYTFRVRASVLNQESLSNSKDLVVIIKTPFWQKNWFKGLALLFIVLVVYLFFSIRIWVLKKQKQKLEKKVTSRTAELRETNQLLSEKTEEITCQKEEIERIALELKEADQLKTRFFMNISHEFRTPLTLILGPLEQLKESPVITNNNLQLFHLMERNAKRLLRLVNQLLDLRKLETNSMKLKVSEADIEAFLSDVYHHFDYTAKRYSVNYRFVAKPGDYTGFFDKDIVEKVMYNLLSNAFKYVKDDGTISIALDKPDPLELSAFNLQGSAVKPGEYIRIEVRDNGIGIDEEKLPYIFDRFYQATHATSKRQKGTGIGLSLTKELIHLHKGRITVESTRNKGTKFSLVLPVSKTYFHVNEITSEGGGAYEDDYSLIAEESSVSINSEIFSDNQGQKALILVVDDNYDVREYLKSCLSPHFQVVEAENGKTGYLKAKENMPDIIIADIMMPVVDGYALSQKIKEDITLNHIPLILLTAKSGKEDELTGLNTGADDYITKPFYRDVLLARINTLLKNRGLIREKIKRELIDNGKPVPSFEEKFLKRVNSVCEENMEASEFNVEQLCEILNISQPQLYRKIKSLTDYSPFEFIRILRLKKAARLLINDADNVSQIAYSVGFTDPKYFSKCFKAFFGKSPRVYKTDMKKKSTL